jgi:hypothetical protein
MAARAWARARRGAAAAALSAALACGAEPPEPVILVPEPARTPPEASADDAPGASAIDRTAASSPRPPTPTGTAPPSAAAPAETALAPEPGTGPGGADRRVLRLDDLPESVFEEDLPKATPQRDRSGRTVGLAISKVRPGSFAHGLGLRDGDVVHRVDGQPITTVADALGVMTKPRPRDVDVDLTRDGRPTTLRYRLE